MKKLIKTTLLIIIGVASCILTACNQNTNTTDKQEASKSEVTESSLTGTLSYYIDLSPSGDILSLTQGNNPGQAGIPEGIKPMTDEAIKKGLALTTLLKNKEGEVVGYGSELENFKNGTGPGIIWDAYWTLVIPGKGSIYVFENEMMPENQTEAYQTVGQGKNWKGNLVSRMAVGPREDGWGTILSGTGEFENAKGRFAEFVTLNELNTDGSIQSIMELRFEFGK